MAHSFKKSVLFFLLLLSGWQGLAQGGFKKKYYLQNSLTSVCHDVLEAPDGNLVTIGYTYKAVGNVAFNQLTLVGTDNLGNMLWRKDFGDKKFQYLDNSLVTRGAIKDNSGIYFTCSVLDSLNGNYSVLIKFNYSGDTLWQKIYKDSAYDLISQAVCKTVDGGLLLTGFMQSNNLPNQPLFLLKTDINGNELWSKKLISSNTADPAWSGHRSVQDTLTKRIITVGYQYLGIDVLSLALCTDSVGTVLWQNTYNNSGGGGFGEIIQTKDKNFVACGAINTYSTLGNFTLNKSLAVKFNIYGAPIWSKTYDTLSPFTGISCLVELPNEDILMSGGLDTMLRHNLPLILKPRIFKIDKNGNLKWKKYIGDANTMESSEVPQSTNPTQDGGFILATSLPFASSPRPYRIIKIDSTGCDTLEAYCQSQALGIADLSGLPDIGLDVFPNPASNFVDIRIDAAPGASYSISITDVSGRAISNTAYENNSTLSINTANYEAGVYFLNVLQEGKTVGTRRLIIVK